MNPNNKHESSREETLEVVVEPLHPLGHDDNDPRVSRITAGPGRIEGRAGHDEFHEGNVGSNAIHLVTNPVSCATGTMATPSGPVATIEITPPPPGLGDAASTSTCGFRETDSFVETMYPGGLELENLPEVEDVDLNKLMVPLRVNVNVNVNTDAHAAIPQPPGSTARDTAQAAKYKAIANSNATVPQPPGSSLAESSLEDVAKTTHTCSDKTQIDALFCKLKEASMQLTAKLGEPPGSTARDIAQAAKYKAATNSNTTVPQPPGSSLAESSLEDVAKTTHTRSDKTQIDALFCQLEEALMQVTAKSGVLAGLPETSNGMTPFHQLQQSKSTLKEIKTGAIHPFPATPASEQSLPGAYSVGRMVITTDGESTDGEEDSHTGSLTNEPEPSLTAGIPDAMRAGSLAWDMSGRTATSTAASSGIAAIENENENNNSADRNESDGLAVARIVEETSEHRLAFEDLPQAVDMDPASRTTKRERPTKQLALGGLFCFVVIIVVYIVIVILVARYGDQGSISALPATAAPSSFPSASPTFSAEQYVMSLLPDYTIRSLKDRDSPQFSAFTWSVNDIDLGEIPFLTDERVVQRFALASVYFSLSGGAWSLNANWLDHNIHECLWFQSLFFSMEPVLSGLYPGYLAAFAPSTQEVCDITHGRLQHFWMDPNNMHGTLPKEFYLLTNLQTLSIAYNGIEGGISSSIGNLSSLEGLAFFGLINGGVIPTQVGLLSNLKVLSLHASNLAGTIPDEVWKLTDLQYLVLNNNGISGTIPTEVGRLKELRFLSFDGNALTGSLPTELGRLVNLEWLVFSLNAMAGTIPTELGLLTIMELFTLAGDTNHLSMEAGGNSLIGTIPTEFGAWTSLKLFNVFSNLLTGTLPTELGLLTELTLSCTASVNKLSGPIPSELGQLSLLQELLLDTNDLTGTIPTELGLLTSMGFLKLSHTSLSGTIPTQLEAMQTSLHNFAIDMNPYLSGVVPEGLCNITGTCDASFSDLKPCYPTHGSVFDCTPRLCGCGCLCN